MQWLQEKMQHRRPLSNLASLKEQTIQQLLPRRGDSAHKNPQNGQKNTNKFGAPAGI
jgi:hypothetical protein